MSSFRIPPLAGGIHLSELSDFLGPPQSDALTREAKSSEDIEDIIAEYQKQRGPQPNISFFAFTATPRNVTLERFGTIREGSLPDPFHLYSMRQAIEEGFILDVLQNYMTYRTYYQLEKAIEDDPELSGRRGQRKVARFASLHPTAIGQKVEVTVEHFRRHVMGKINGQAKAMIVTQSREHALKYYFCVRDYIKAQGYADLRALVAFSGDLTFDGETYTEADLNSCSETELPGRFDGFKPDGTPYPDSQNQTLPKQLLKLRRPALSAYRSMPIGCSPGWSRRQRRTSRTSSPTMAR